MTNEPDSRISDLSAPSEELVSRNHGNIFKCVVSESSMAQTTSTHGITDEPENRISNFSELQEESISNHPNIFNRIVSKPCTSCIYDKPENQISDISKSPEKSISRNHRKIFNRIAGRTNLSQTSSINVTIDEPENRISNFSESPEGSVPRNNNSEPSQFLIPFEKSISKNHRNTSDYHTSEPSGSQTDGLCDDIERINKDSSDNNNIDDSDNDINWYEDDCYYSFNSISNLEIASGDSNLNDSNTDERSDSSNELEKDSISNGNETNNAGENHVQENRVWIFGYGSLCWNPGFSFEKSLIGYIKGFSRKFWQGSITHRGTEKQPGRVATLIDDNKGVVWGRVFQVTKDNSVALKYLDSRECCLGGYLPLTVTVHIKQHSSTLPSNSISAITFVAYSGNSFWLGDAPLLDISIQILRCKGHAGHNVEYLLKLAEYMRMYVPDETDFELFALEALIRNHIKENNLCIQELSGKPLPTSNSTIAQSLNNQNATIPTAQLPEPSREFASRIPSKKLRCLNI